MAQPLYLSFIGLIFMAMVALGTMQIQRGRLVSGFFLISMGLGGLLFTHRSIPQH